jgi:hypothetical protein
MLAQNGGSCLYLGDSTRLSRTDLSEYKFPSPWANASNCLDLPSPRVDALAYSITNFGSEHTLNSHALCAAPVESLQKPRSNWARMEPAKSLQPSQPNN